MAFITILLGVRSFAHGCDARRHRWGKKIRNSLDSDGRAPAGSMAIGRAPTCAVIHISKLAPDVYGYSRHFLQADLPPPIISATKGQVVWSAHAFLMPDGTLTSAMPLAP